MYYTVGESVQSGGSQDGWEVSELDRDQYVVVLRKLSVFFLSKCFGSPECT